MKKIILICLILYSINSFSQSFPRNSPELLIGRKVKPIDLNTSAQKYGYRNFFVNFDTITKKHIINDSVNRPFNNNRKSSSDYDKLNSLVFIVEKMYKVESDKPQSNDRYDKESYNVENYMLRLINEEIGVLYYLYNNTIESYFELELANNEVLPNDFFCNDLLIEKDKFTGETIHRSPNVNQGIFFIKYEKNNIRKYYMSISVDGHTLNVGEKGVYILFDNGKKISKLNEDIDVDSNTGAYSSGWRYSAFIRLSQEDLKLLKKNKITDVKLFIYQNEISNKNSTILREYINCMTK